MKAYNLSKIMKAAWSIAKAAASENSGKASEYIAEAMKMAWAEAKKAEMKPVSERIEELEALGFRRWRKGDFDRLYINAESLGLEVFYYKHGDVCKAIYDGEVISNRQCHKLSAHKTYIDVKTGILYGSHAGLLEKAARLAGISETRATEYRGWI